MEIISSLLTSLQNLSDTFGTGNLSFDAGVVVLTGAVLLIALMILLWLMQRRSTGRAARADQERNQKLAGRVEKFEMNMNSVRTELAREIEFLKLRVERLEDQLGIAEEGGRVQPEVSAAPEEAPVEAGAEEIPAAEPAAPASLSNRLTKTRSGFFQKLKGIFSGQPKLQEDTLEDLEALLVSSDLGVKMTESLIEHLKAEIGQGASIDEQGLVDILEAKVRDILELDAPEGHGIEPWRRGNDPLVVMLVGVNGVGKTTTAAKLASKWKASGANVLLVAADTFRAAAVEQLVHWGERIDVPVVRGAAEARPAAVVYEAMEQAKRDQIDVVLIDTAGRLHTRSNLMQELEGIRNVVQKHVPGAPHEVVLVVDGSTGQNALSQAREFKQSVNVSGLVVTKLDGTPKGGIVVAIKSDLGIPIYYIGVGEGPEDLRAFDPESFAEALFTRDSKELSENGSAHGRRRRRRREEGLSLGN